MSAKVLAAAIGIIAAGVAGGLFALSEPHPVAAASLSRHMPDLANGQVMYNAAGCIACHKPAGQSDGDQPLPSGGAGFKTPVGTFYPPQHHP